MQVEYMFYSRAENPRLRVTKEEEEQYYDRGFVKIDESAICVVCSKYFCSQLFIDRSFNTNFHCSEIFSIPIIHVYLGITKLSNKNYGSNDCADNYWAIYLTHIYTSVGIFKVMPHFVFYEILKLRVKFKITTSELKT